MEALRLSTLRTNWRRNSLSASQNGTRRCPTPVQFRKSIADRQTPHPFSSYPYSSYKPVQNVTSSIADCRGTDGLCTSRSSKAIRITKTDGGRLRPTTTRQKRRPLFLPEQVASLNPLVKKD